MHIISGKYKGRTIQTPKGMKTRPTSARLRESLFNICQGYEQVRFLDLFAGSGAMGLEALSRGAQFATFVDNSRESIRCIQLNVSSFEVEDCVEVMFGDVFQVLAKLAGRNSPYDIIYADPPYDQVSKEKQESMTYSTRILKIVDKFGQLLISPGGSLFLEDSSKALPQADSLEHLVLKNTRQMGHSALQHYIPKKTLKNL